MRKVFLLEDTPEELDRVKVVLAEAVGYVPDFAECKTSDEAERRLQFCSPRTFQLLLFDLHVPNVSGQIPNWKNGFAALRAAWKAGHREGLVVLSVLADEASVLEAKSILEKEGIFVEKWLSKTEDLRTVEDWRWHFLPFLEDLTPLVEYLKQNRFFVVDNAQTAVLHELVQRVRKSMRSSQGELPVIYFTGDTGDGKTDWAEALKYIKGFLLNTSTPSPVSYKPTSLAEIPGEWNESDRLKLFGARAWSTKEGNIYQDDFLVQATKYIDCQQVVVVRSDPTKLTVDRQRSGYCLLDEVLSAHPRAHDAFLRVIDTGTVEPVGSKSDQFPVGCGLIFATNLDRSEAIITRGPAQERGSMSVAFRDRLGAPIQVPRLTDMQFDSVVQILESLYQKIVSPAAKKKLKEFHERGEINLRSLTDIADSAVGPRLTEDFVQRILNQRSIKKPEFLMTVGNKETSVEHRLKNTQTQLPNLADFLLQKPGWPVKITAECIVSASEAWKEIQKSDGARIKSKLTQAIRLLRITPSDLLALIIIAKADVIIHKVKETQLEKWFGLRKKGNENDLRNKLRGLSLTYPEVFSGSGKEMASAKGAIRPVLISDVAFWAEIWLEWKNRSQEVSDA